MRSLKLAIVVAVILGAVCVPSTLAQQPTGPATLENLITPDELEKPAAGPEVKTPEAGPNRPSGVVVRPKDGVQHPDLDKAWAEYDAAVAKAAESIKAAITKQFDVAAAKGDLDAAEKWQAIGESFIEDGKVPSEEGTKAVVSGAMTNFKRAEDDLLEAYESVVKTLTMEKKIADARAVRSEARAIVAADKSDLQSSVLPHKSERSPSDDKTKGAAVFLSDLPEQDAKVGFGSFGKNGDLGFGGGLGATPRQIIVRGRESPKGLSMCPPSFGASKVTYLVPKGFTHLKATVGINDFAANKQVTPVVFKVMGDEKLLWESPKLIGEGRVAVCSISLKGASAVTLIVECPGDHMCAHAVWVDPHFFRK